MEFSVMAVASTGILSPIALGRERVASTRWVSDRLPRIAKDGAKNVPRLRPWNANALLHSVGIRHFQYHLHFADADPTQSTGI